MSRELTNRFHVIRRGDGVLDQATSLSLAAQKASHLFKGMPVEQRMAECWIYDALVDKHICPVDILNHDWIAGHPDPASC